MGAENKHLQHKQEKKKRKHGVFLQNLEAEICVQTVSDKRTAKCYRGTTTCSGRPKVRNTS